MNPFNTSCCKGLDKVQELCGVSFINTEDHVDAEFQEQKETIQVKKKIYIWSFPIAEGAMSINNEIVGDDKINRHKDGKLVIHSDA